MFYWDFMVFVHHVILGFLGVYISWCIGISWCLYIMLYWDFMVFVHHVVLGFHGVFTSCYIGISWCLYIMLYWDFKMFVHHVILGFHGVCTSFYIGISRCLYIMLYWDFKVFVHHVILRLHNDGTEPSASGLAPGLPSGRHDQFAFPYTVPCVRLSSDHWLLWGKVKGKGIAPRFLFGFFFFLCWVLVFLLPSCQHLGFSRWSGQEQEAPSTFNLFEKATQTSRICSEVKFWFRSLYC